MTRNQKIGGGAVGFAAVAGAMFLFSGTVEVTPVEIACAECPSGPAKVCAYAYNPSDPDTHETCQDVTFPIAGNVYRMEFANLPKRDYQIRFNVRYADGQTRSSGSADAAPLMVMGRGDEPDIPLPLPTLTPTTTPTTTPTPTGTPQPVPTDCQQVSGGKDAAGNAWSIVQGAGHVWLVTPDGEPGYAFPGGAATLGAAADHFVFAAGVAYGHEPRDGQYYRLTGRNAATKATPTCASPTPTATPTPTVTPTPTPTPTPPADVCVSTPLKVSGIKWPAQQTGSRTGSWNSGTFRLVSAGFEWTPTLRFVAKDSRGCTVTVNR